MSTPGLPAPIAITMGDACGIGPEIIAMALSRPEGAGCVVLGDVEVMRRAVAWVGVDLPVVELDTQDDLSNLPPRSLPVWPVVRLPALPVVGRVDAQAGAAARACVAQAVALALGGRISAVVTAPLNKAALAAAGIEFPGHTEMLQADAAAGPVRMMLANDALKVVLVSVHMSLRAAIDALTLPALLETLRITHRAARSWGVPRPRIAVAGLNPHAGEGGLFGDEETRIIEPAIRQACAEGIDASGPYAPDTVFMRARAPDADSPGEFDVVVAMYHDQGLIPVKYLGLADGVNITLGLPFVRTSPDHGTAFDLAGTGKADPSSLMAALRMARRLSGHAPGGGARG